LFVTVFFVTVTGAYTGGVREDGSFYGDLLSVWESTRIIDSSRTNGVGRTIDGTLSQTDRRRFAQLVAGVGFPGAKPIDGWTGLLAEGPIDAPVSRFYYVPGAERTSSEAARFLAIIDLLEEYTRPYCVELTRRAEPSEADE
jgi:hypothetical protein